MSAVEARWRSGPTAGCFFGCPPATDVQPLPNNLPWKMVRGAKEFHLHAQPVKHELLPNDFMNHWGYNGSIRS